MKSLPFYDMLTFFLVIGCTSFVNAKRIPRIFNGDDAKIQYYPYQVSLDYDGAHLCGGSIISKHYVLTAAHCSNLVPDIDQLYVRAGSSFPSKGGTLHKVVELIGHKGFDFEKYERPIHDIAIAKVEEPFAYGDTCQPIELFKENEKAIPGSKAIVTGYGLVTKTKPADQLQSVMLTIISKQSCKKAHEVLPEKEICALGENGKGPCTGDSGGPIAIDGRLAGIVSWGEPECDPAYPSVYTEVAQYHDWINEHVQFD